MTAQDVPRDTAESRRYRELENELDDFLHAFSHDFTASLRQTKQFSRLLLKKIDITSNAEATRFAALMERSMERSDDLMNSLRVLSCATVRNDHPVSLDCVPLIARILESCASNDISTSFVGPSVVNVIGDPTQVRVLFSQLVDNATGYRREGEPLEVRVTAEPLGAGWRFEVHDTGAGFTTRELDGVFRLFRNIDSGERNTRVGLGLPMCRAIVRRHDGEIRCERSTAGDTSLVLTLGTSLPPRTAGRDDRAPSDTREGRQPHSARGTQ